MANQSPTYYAQEFANVLVLLLQQMGSKLRGTVMEKKQYGQQASPVDQVGSIEMQPVIGRFNPMGRIDAPANRRWVTPNPYDLPQLVDDFDVAQMIIDPKGPYMQNALMAAGRQYDRQIIAAGLGVSQTGVEAGTPVSLPSANKVTAGFAASGNVGLTVRKFREAKRLLASFNVDFDKEQLYCAIHPTNADQLLGEAQVVSSDFNGGNPVLVEGRIRRFMGFEIKETTLMPYIPGGTVRQCLFYCKSGIHLGVWEDIKTKISQRDDLQDLPWQIYLKMMIGATRLEENRVIEVDCQE